MPDADHLVEVFTHIGVQLGRVAERSALHNRVRQAQKMEAVGQLAAGVAHEINDPMAYVRSNLNSLAREMVDLAAKLGENEETQSLARNVDECQELLTESLDGVERTIVVRDIEELSHAGGGEPGERQISDLSRLLDGARRVASGHLPTRRQLRAPRIAHETAGARPTAGGRVGQKRAR